MTTCYRCAKIIVGTVFTRGTLQHPSEAKAFHPACYEAAELDANCELFCDERNEFAQFDLNELISYRNILTMSARCLQITDDKYRNARHLRFVNDELDIRGHRLLPGKNYVKAKTA